MGARPACDGRAELSPETRKGRSRRPRDKPGRAGFKGLDAAAERGRTRLRPLVVVGRGIRTDKRAGDVAVLAAATAFFGKTYGEALDLVLEARDYLAFFEPDERGALPPVERLVMCSETLRLTARLTQIMAWLLAQRAVQCGELSRDAALAEPLAALDICMDGEDREGGSLPPRLGALLGRSRRLYVRVARLDEMARRGSPI